MSRYRLKGLVKKTLQDYSKDIITFLIRKKKADDPIASIEELINICRSDRWRVNKVCRILIDNGSIIRIQMGLYRLKDKDDRS